MSPTSDQTPYPEVLREAARAASDCAHRIREAIAAIAPGDPGIRSLGRRLGVTTALATALLRIVHSADPIASLTAMPGKRGRIAILSAFARCLPAPATQQLRESFAAIEAVLEGHDRETLRAILAGARDDAETRREVRLARRSAYEASRYIYGVHAQGMLCAQWIAPSSDGMLCDLVGGQIFAGVERIRPGPWINLFFAPARYRVGESLGRGHAFLPIDDSPHPPIVADLSSPDLRTGEVRCAEVPNASAVQFGQAAPDRRAPIDLCCAIRLDRFAPMHREEDDDAGEMTVGVHFPMKRAVVEVWMHHALARGGEPSAMFHSLGFKTGQRVDWRDDLRLPFAEQAEAIADPFKLPRDLERVSKAHRALAERACALRGHTVKDYRCFRIDLPHPLMHSTATIRWRLGDPPPAS